MTKCSSMLQGIRSSFNSYNKKEDSLNNNEILSQIKKTQKELDTLFAALKEFERKQKKEK